MSGPSRVRIAYLCDRLGPYHVAQLLEASKNAAITAIEYSATDLTYAWDRIEDAGRLDRVTLYRGLPITEQSRRMVVNKLRRVLDDMRPQIVAIPGWDAPASLAALQWCLETRTPTILMSDSQEKDEPRVWWKEAVKGRVVRLATAGFVGGAPHVQYLKALGMAEQRIVTGGDVVDNGHFANGALTARRNAVAVRRQLSLPDHYFLASARFIPKKNLFAVLRAYANYLLTAGNQGWKLVLLGDGPLKAQLMQRAGELGISGMVYMPGFKQYAELPAYYGLASAFVLASTSEQWGLVVNEAMACGLPVIVSARCGCASDLVRHGENGFVVDPYDIEQLAQYLAYVASNECPRSAMGNASRRIVAGWDLQRFGRSLCEAAELANQSPQRRLALADRALLWALIHRPRS